MPKEHRLFFCINLEVIIFQDREFGLFFGRSFETIIGFRNLLTFRHRQASCASACSSFVPYWKSPKLYRQLWTSQVLISVPSLLFWNANITGKSAQRASKNIICMLPWTLVKCRSILGLRMVSYILINFRYSDLSGQQILSPINPKHELYHKRRLIQIVQNRRAISSFRTIFVNLTKISLHILG